MNVSDPERPAQESQPGGFEYPSSYPGYSDYPSESGFPPPTYPPPPPSGYPGVPAYYPYRQLTPPGTNGKAIASLVTSIAGWVCCAPLAIVGLILGVLAMRETRRTGQEGWGMALAGTLIGGLFTVALVIVLLLYIAPMFSGWQWT